MKINGILYYTKYKVLSGILYNEIIVDYMSPDMKKGLTTVSNSDSMVSIEYIDEDRTIIFDTYISYFGSNKFYITKD